MADKPVVLAVDDDPLILDLICLDLLACDVRMAGSGAQALNLLADLRPDVILLDVRMPHMDGLQTLQAIRARPGLAAARVMMLTAVADRPTISKALAAGANGYLLKPFTRANLIHRVNKLLRRSDPNDAEI